MKEAINSHGCHSVDSSETATLSESGVEVKVSLPSFTPTLKTVKTMNDRECLRRARLTARAMQRTPNAERPLSAAVRHHLLLSFDGILQPFKVPFLFILSLAFNHIQCERRSRLNLVQLRQTMWSN
jgi:hypothetical protein